MKRIALLVIAALWLAAPATAQVVRVYEVRHRIEGTDQHASLRPDGAITAGGTSGVADESMLLVTVDVE